MTQAPIIIKSHEYKVESTKSEFVYDADISQALHKSGNWYLIPRKYCYQYLGTKLESLVFHVCAKSWLCKSNPDERGVEKMSVVPYTLHRMTPADMQNECTYCYETPHNDLVGLWTLHNWNYLSENDHTA
jgi:hypothetical protein